MITVLTYLKWGRDLPGRLGLSQPLPAYLLALLVAPFRGSCGTPGAPWSRIAGLRLKGLLHLEGMPVQTGAVSLACLCREDGGRCGHRMNTCRISWYDACIVGSAVWARNIVPLQRVCSARVSEPFLGCNWPHLREKNFTFNFHLYVLI